MRTRRSLSSLSCLTITVMLTGCSLSQPAPLRYSYLLGPPVVAPTAAAADASATAAPVLRINRFTVAQPFEGKALVYRIAEQRFEADYYNEFLASPATMLTEGTIRYLAATRLFKAVVPMTSSIDSPLLLEAAVTALHGDFRSGVTPAAVLGIRFLLADESTAGTILFDQLLTRRIAASSRSAEALVAALDRALGEILAELTDELRQLELTRRVHGAGTIAQ